MIRSWINSFIRALFLIVLSIYRAKRLPFLVRELALRFSFQLQPIGGGIGQNGAKVLIKIQTGDSAGSVEFISGQSNLSISDKTAEIDISDKLSGRLGERVPGRATASITVDVNFVRDDAVRLFLLDEYRNRRNVSVTVFQRTNLDDFTSFDDIAGDDVESCEGIIVDFSEAHGDQTKSTCSLQISLNNDWVAAASA